MHSYRRLQQFALAISILSVFYNAAEGAVSVVFGAEASSRSLIFFGVQSGIEVLSSALVVWRFRKIAKPGDERGVTLRGDELRFEKFGTLGIGLLLIALSLATEASSIASLVLRHEPDSSNASLIISATSVVLMIFFWLPKRYLAKALDSSVMNGEAICSLSCIQLTVVLLVGSLVFKVWKGGWWVDGATAIVLGLLFGWEGLKMIRWATNKDFGGGCCASHCVPPSGVAEAELGEVYRDMCSCCLEKEECKNANECKCPPTPTDSLPSTTDCCIGVQSNGDKCCTREIIPGARQPPATVQELPCNANNIVSPEGDITARTATTSEVPKSHCCDDC